MEYLKAFIIGTSGLVWVQHVALLSLRDKDEYDYSFKTYSIIAPIYYGIMTMLALYIGRKFNLSLRLRLFIISILSICFIVAFNYFISSKKYKPYKDYTTKEWIRYILTNGARHVIAFNLIIFYFTKFFSKYYWLRIFIIGSSIISYLWTYLKVCKLDNQKKLNYDYKAFAVGESIGQGLLLMTALYVLQRVFKYKLKQSFIIYAFVTPVIWLFLSYNLKTYKYKGDEWLRVFKKVYIVFIIKSYILYSLVIRLK